MSGETYAIEALAHCGLVIDDAEIAAKLRPDIFGGGQPDSLYGFTGGIGRAVTKRGANPYRAILEGGIVEVWAVWPGNLAQRIEWVLGEKVIEVVPKPIEKPKHKWTARISSMKGF